MNAHLREALTAEPEFPNRLGPALRYTGLSQRDLAVKLGLPPSRNSYISLVVTGKIVPTIARARQIATVLGVSVDELWP